MTTEPLDLENLLGELDDRAGAVQRFRREPSWATSISRSPTSRRPSGSIATYTKFDEMATLGSQATFLSVAAATTYVGANTWAKARAHRRRLRARRLFAGPPSS